MAFLSGMGVASDAGAQSSTWTGTTSTYGTAGNWTAGTVPGATGEAMFGNGGAASVDVLQDTTAGRLTFGADAQAYTITLRNAGTQLILGRAGIVNGSGRTQTLVATAGTRFEFDNNSSAGHATYVTGGDITSTSLFGRIYFRANSTAGSVADPSIHATIVNNSGGSTNFWTRSSAAFAHITNNRDGHTAFTDTTTAADATIVTNDRASTLFDDRSTGGRARFITHAGGKVDFSGTLGPGSDGTVTAGSFEGAGTYRLGANRLRVGGSNRSTEVAGQIADGGKSGGTGASLVKEGTGVLTLSGHNSYSGGTVVAGGVLSVAADTALGAASGALTVDGGILRVTGTGFTGTGRPLTWGAAGGGIDIADPANAFTLNQPLSGAGSLAKLGPGTLTLTGTNSYSGGTTVSGGTLRGTAASLGRGGIVNDAALVFEQNTDASFDFPITGGGTLVKTGSGALDLGGASPFSGPTTVEAGRLAVNGSIARSVVTVGRDAILSGNGTVGGIMALDRATIAPGNSIGRLGVAGDVGFAPGSVYQVEIDGAGRADRIDAAGAASLLGGTVRIQADQGRYSTEPYTILTAQGGVTGRFARTAGDDFAFVTPTLGYGPKAVTLTLVRKVEPEPPTPEPPPSEPSASEPPTPEPPAPQPPPADARTPQPPDPRLPTRRPERPKPVPLAFSSAAVTRNQFNVANAVEALGGGNRLFDAVLGSSRSGARQAFGALSGEAHASMANAALGQAGLIQNVLMGRLRGLPGDGTVSLRTAYAADRPTVPAGSLSVRLPGLDPRRFALWGDGFGAWSRIRSDRNAAAVDTATGGFVIGAEARLGGISTLGIAGGFARSTLESRTSLSSGTNESVFGALYGSTEWGAVTLRLGASFASHDIDVARTVSFPGFADRTHASYGGSTAAAFGELGYRIDVGRVRIEPFLGASAMRLHTGRFVEEGGAAALAGSARSSDLGTATLGLRAEARIGGDLPLTLRGMVGWRHAFGDLDPAALLAFAGTASAFSASGVPVDRNLLVAEAGLDWQVSPDIGLGVTYAGQVGERAQAHALKGHLALRF